MRFHWQNLNDSETHPRRGGGARHGRAWLTIFHSPEARTRDEEKDPKFRYRPGWSINWEWSFLWSAACHLSLAFVRHEGVGVEMSLALPWLFSIHVALLGGPFAWLTRKLLPRLAKDQRPRYPGQELPIRDYSDRALRLSVYDWAIWWNVWTDPMGGWSSRWSRWRKMRDSNFRPIDFVFGRTKFAERVIFGPASVLIPMPERAYQATVSIVERTWRRPRWPFGVWRRWLAHDVDCKQDPVPVPGKGENSWDCGEDAIYGHGGPSKSGMLEEAIASVVESVMNSRRRHGGSVTWAPKEDHRPKSGPTSPQTPTAMAERPRD